MKRIRWIIGTAWVLAQILPHAFAAESTVKAVALEPPKEVSESIRQMLQPKSVQVQHGDKAQFQFWFRSDIPLKAKPESATKGLEALDETTLLGVVIVGEGQRDYKDNAIVTGTYTLRFGLQPQDGDHLGTSDFLTFVVLIPIASDTALDGIKTYKAMVKASRKSTDTGHPGVLSLRPPANESPDLAITTPAEEHEAVHLKLSGKSAEGEAPLIFELVIRGRYKH